MDSVEGLTMHTITGWRNGVADAAEYLASLAALCPQHAASATCPDCQLLAHLASAAAIVGRSTDKPDLERREWMRQQYPWIKGDRLLDAMVEEEKRYLQGIGS